MTRNGLRPPVLESAGAARDITPIGTGPVNFDRAAYRAALAHIVDEVRGRDHKLARGKHRSAPAVYKVALGIGTPPFIVVDIIRIALATRAIRMVALHPRHRLTHPNEVCECRPRDHQCTGAVNSSAKVFVDAHVPAFECRQRHVRSATVSDNHEEAPCGIRSDRLHRGLRCTARRLTQMNSLQVQRKGSLHYFAHN